MRHGALILATAVVLGGCGGGSQAHDGGAGDTAVQLDMGTPPDTAGADAGADAGGPDGPPFVPTAADIAFAAVHPLPTGEQILFNDWGTNPNAVFSMTPDGTTVTEVFRAYRVWSMGVARAVDRIAFSCGYPADVQEAHYGVTIGDLIQHTFMYDVATETVAVVAYGNINDECLTFGPGDDYLYLCRRYDFAQSGSSVTNRGYRLGRLDLATLAFTFLTPDVTLDYALSPQPTPDEQQLLYGRIVISGQTQTRTVMQMALPGGTPTQVLAQASFPVLSPDGTRLAYQNWADNYTLWIAAVDGGSPVKLANRQRASEAVFSPDGTKVAYLYDGLNGTTIEWVKADGSEADAPHVVRDTAVSGEFITELEWITR